MNLADSDKVTALHKACFNDHADCARLLLSRGALVELADKFGSTALHKAAFGGSGACCSVLLESGADAKVFDGEGFTAVHLATHRQHEDALKVLLAFDAKLGSCVSQNAVKETPLHFAARVGSVSCASILLTAGADPSTKAANGDTVAELAKRFGHEEVAALVSKGKDEHPAPQVEPAVAVAVAEAADRTADGVVVDRWGFLGSQLLDEDEEQHKLKEVEREIKWVEMRNNWDRWVARRSKKLKQRCLKGIPDSFRPFAWVRLSGARDLRGSKPDNYYSELISRQEETQALEVIHRDLHRTFPDHVQFRAATGRDSLMRVLKAFSFHNPKIGYCQGMGFVAAMFLMYCVEEQVQANGGEIYMLCSLQLKLFSFFLFFFFFFFCLKDAFWMLVRLVDHYGMGGLWDSGLTAVPVMCYMHDQLLAKLVPRVRQHLDSQMISGALYAPSFYITGFSYSLPWPCVL